MTDAAQTKVLIVGAGFGGVGLAIRLRKQEFTNFEILERGDDVGGVWRDNTYPGCACDVASRLYSYSFEDWDWSSRFAPQSEILAYIRHCAKKHDILRHVRFGVEVREGAFDETRALWRVAAKDGRVFEAHVLVSAVGLFNRAAMPDIPGLQDFRGSLFHSSKWNHDAPIDGGRVAVIGTGASAIQFVPEIARRARDVLVVQRSPQYVMAKTRDRTPGETRWWHKTALWRRWERLSLFLALERSSQRRANRAKTALAQAAWRAHLEQEIPDEALRGKLTPSYALGCKRVLQSNDWYPTLRRPNVELADGVARILPFGLRTADGRDHVADVIILNTGFRTTEYVTPMTLRGLGGVKINAQWAGRPRAHLGIVVAGMPNFFMMYGPNANGSASIVYLLECQARYIARCVRTLARGRADWMRVREDVYERSTDAVKSRLGRTVLADPDCRTYFKTQSGDIVTQWPGTMLEYRLRTTFPVMSDFVFESKRPGAPTPKSGAAPVAAEPVAEPA